MILFDKHRRARKNMSAYADGELPAKETTKLEVHIASCEQCRLELDELRATIGALRSLPEVSPRRSFALTPQMVEAPVPARSAGPSPTLVQGLRLTAAGLAAALVLVFVIDVADSGTSDNDSSATGFFYAGGALERATDDANVEAAGGDNELSPLSKDEDISTTAVPAPASDYADTAPDSPTANPEAFGGGISSEVNGGDGSEPDGAVAEPDGGDGEDATTEGLPATGDREAYGADNDAQTSSGEAPQKAVGDAENASTDGDGDDAANREAASPSTDDGDFDTLLALEIGLGAALALAMTGAIWLTIAARRREVRH